jgi:archaellum biogenesis protein FlaJ (TadC family)
MTDKVNMLIWFYNDHGKVKSLKLGKFLNSINKRINLGNSAQEFFATEKLALKNKVRLYWKERNK